MSVKNIPLKAMKLRDVLSEDDLARSLSQQARSCLSILSGEPLASYEQVYKECDRLCRHGQWKTVYSGIVSEVTNYSRTELLQIFSKCSTLEQVVSAWSAFEKNVRAVQDVFSVLDRVYCKRETGVIRLAPLLFGLFRQHVWAVEGKKMNKMAMQSADELRSRLDVSVDLDLLANYFKMTVRIDTFSSNVKGILLERTFKHYNGVFVDRLRAFDLRQMVDFVIQVWAFEHGICKVYPEGVQSEMKSVLGKVLISDRMAYWSEDCLNEFVTRFDIEYCQKLYQLMGFVDAHSILCSCFGLVIKQTALGILGSDSQNIISLLLSFKDQAEGLVSQALYSNAHFINAAKDGIESAINSQAAYVAELLAFHFNLLLITPMTDVDMLRLSIDKGIALFRHIQGKEVFEALSKRFLSQRLLARQSIGIDYEQLFMSRLKDECGAAFTSRMDGMIRDVSISRDTTSAFQKSSAYRSRPHSAAFSVNIMTGGIWPPSASNSKIFVPEVIERDVQLFETHYYKYARKRRLSWDHSLDECIIRVSFDNGPVDISMPNKMAAILLQFDYCNELAVSSLLSLSKLDPGTFQKSLNVLKSLDVLREEDSRVLFNAKASLPDKVYLHYPQQLLPSFTASQEASHSDLTDEERSFRVDAAIVRLLKKKGKCSLDELQESVGNIDLLEGRLKVLLTRDYCKQENGMYVYIP